MKDPARSFGVPLGFCESVHVTDDILDEIMPVHGFESMVTTI
jgi:hypothetical protein